VVDVTEGGEEGTFLDIRLLEVLAEGVLPISLVPTRVVVARANLLLALIRETSDEVVRVAAVEASILRTTMSLVLAVVEEPREPTGHKRQLLIPEALHLFLCDGQQ
jgi:hypothetical protein